MMPGRRSAAGLPSAALLFLGRRNAAARRGAPLAHRYHGRMADSPIDVVYLFRHSKHGDEEIRFSLRSVAKNLSFIRKVWIFGDRPAFLADDHSIIEHVPHEYIAPLLGFKTPVH